MVLIDPTTFDDKDVALVYVAARRSEAKRVEQVLSDHAVDYAVAAEPFEHLVLGLLPMTYEGVGFYVLAGQAEFCRGLLHAAGLVQGLVEDDRD
jgi:hypothetical protein